MAKLAEFRGLIQPTAGARTFAAEEAKSAQAPPPPTRNPVVGRVTLSIGAAEAGGDDRDEDSALKIADGRLYRAKADGRNRVVDGTPSVA